MSARRRQRSASAYLPGLARLKYDVAQEIGLLGAGRGDPSSYQQALNDYKYEVARELGLDRDIREVGWPNMTSRDCGRIGGRMGGRIGGQMVKRMIEFAKNNLS